MLRDIGGDGRRAEADRGLVERSLGAAGDHDLRSLVHERPGNRQADAGAC
jgi:hypothetical protein